MLTTRPPPRPNLKSQRRLQVDWVNINQCGIASISQPRTCKNVEYSVPIHLTERRLPTWEKMKTIQAFDWTFKSPLTGETKSSNVRIYPDVVSQLSKSSLLLPLLLSSDESEKVNRPKCYLVFWRINWQRIFGSSRHWPHFFCSLWLCKYDN